MIFPIVLAYAITFPSKVVENLITESTEELSKINAQLREEIVVRERAEAELQSHREHLEELVSARTEELGAANAELRRVNTELTGEIAERRRAETALRRRIAELEASNTELDAFAHTAAHDLKTPLTSLIGFSSMLEKRDGDLAGEKARLYVDLIAQSSRKMANIIDELLLLASVRKMDDVPVASLDMADIVAESWKRLSDMLNSAQAEFVTPETWPVALGYGPWVEEIWANYISNAIKYGGAPPRVELGYTILDFGLPIVDLDAYLPKFKIQNPKSKIAFWVQDNGKGLTPDEQARLFVPFTRLDRVRAKGHGLGLSIVRRIVEKLGGEVGVESAPGVVGARFYFTLPAAASGICFGDETPIIRNASL